MNLQFYDSLLREVTGVRPLKSGCIGIYVCGPTVYDTPHLGHARSAVLFDVFRRFCEAVGYDVTLVRNITDIDDKILLRARETGTDYRLIAARYHREYESVMTALNVRPPDAAPWATAYIKPCQEIIARIMHHGHAYRGGTTVYFATRSCPSYGRLSGRSKETPRDHIVRPENPEKRHPDDFALWKGRKDGEPFWDSPWGPGRPGWHIECTAMSHALLGTPFDIHGGGRDLIFPHHENEMAQSAAAFGKHPAGLWLHHGMVTVGQAKMAKSKGNAPPLKSLLSTYHPEAVRLFLLSRHYRRDLPFSEDALQAAAAQHKRLHGVIRRLQVILGDTPPAAPQGSLLWQRFCRCMASDGNLAGGMVEVFTAVRELNRALDSTVSIRRGPLWPTVISTATDVRYICRHILGVLQRPVKDHVQVRRPACRRHLSQSEIHDLVAQRQAARQSSDWTTADRLRKRLEANGIRLQDKDHATIWRQGKRQGQINVFH